MRESGASHDFIARADLIPDLHRDDRRLRLFDDQDLETVLQHRLLYARSGFRCLGQIRREEGGGQSNESNESSSDHRDLLLKRTRD